MRPKTEQEPLDDPAFLNTVDRLTTALLGLHNPDELYLIRLDNWFDQKWLGFSGIGRVRFDGAPMEVALDDLSQDQLTFPPSTPKRVVTEHYFARTTKGYFQEQASPQRVHRWLLEHSACNLQRRVISFSRSGLFVWFTSLSAKNDRASVMVYSAASGSMSAWFASFVKERTWKLHRVKGVSRDWVNGLVAAGVHEVPSHPAEP
jgi:hypothetical protein